MKNYDYNQAKQIIEENKETLIEASLGMYEDWFWTAETVWKNGEYQRELSGKIAGIDGSRWATPTIELIFKDDTRQMIPCHTGGESTGEKNPFGFGVLSGPVQESLPPLSDK